MGAWKILVTVESNVICRRHKRKSSASFDNKKLMYILSAFSIHPKKEQIDLGRYGTPKRDGWDIYKRANKGRLTGRKIKNEGKKWRKSLNKGTDRHQAHMNSKLGSIRQWWLSAAGGHTLGLLASKLGVDDLSELAYQVSIYLLLISGFAHQE